MDDIVIQRMVSYVDGRLDWRKLLLALGMVPICNTFGSECEEGRWIAFANLVLGIAPNMQPGKL